MSGSNAAAIRRRVTAPQQAANIKPPPAPVKQPVKNVSNGLPIQNIISELDKRVVSLEETITKTVKDSTEPTVTDVLDEFQSRFEMIATEISDIKDAMMKLQTYTMDVNKMLLEERIDILSEINPNSKSNVISQDGDLANIISISANNEHTNIDMREMVKEELNKEPK